MSISDDSDDKFITDDSINTNILLQPASGVSGGDIDTAEFATNMAAPKRPSLIKRDREACSTSSSFLKKQLSVSFTTAREENKSVHSANDCLNLMQFGTEMIKIRPNNRQYSRVYTLDSSLKYISWHPSFKKSYKARIRVDSITDVQPGKTSSALRSLPFLPGECCFTIVCGNKIIDLIAHSPKEASFWITGLQCLLSRRTNGSSSFSYGGGAVPDGESLRDQWLEEIYNSAMNASLSMDDHSLVNTIKTYHPYMSTHHIQFKLKEHCHINNISPQSISKSTFTTLFKECATRPEIYHVFVRYGTNSLLTVDDLLTFLEAEQKLKGVNRQKCVDIINTFEVVQSVRNSLCLSIDGFTRYLLSDDSRLSIKEVMDSMSHPISHYYIASSHRTYLLEDQLKGESGIEGYIHALQKGCRCIEIDVWDGPIDTPVVYHGNTFTTKITFEEVLKVVKEYAFKYSLYPLFIMLRTHCSILQQRAMIKCINLYLKEYLFCEYIGGNEQLPSPESLKECILIKGKKINYLSCEEYGEVSDDDAEVFDEKGRKMSLVPAEKRLTKKIKILKELSDLFVFNTVSTLQLNCKIDDLCCLREGLLSPSNEELFVQYTNRNLCQISPSPSRVDSSNLNPLDFWNVGCQFVSFNYQTADLMSDMYHAQFRLNNQCGYVLKPPILRSHPNYFTPSSKESLAQINTKYLRVRIISAQHLPKPKGSGVKVEVLDPYVSVEIYGVSNDCMQRRTKPVDDSSFNPIFEETFQFEVTVPDLAFLRLVILDDDYIGDEFIGQSTIPFSVLKSGYRHIDLNSMTGDLIKDATLFVHISVFDRKYFSNSKEHSLLPGSKSKRLKHVFRSTHIRKMDESFRQCVSKLSLADYLCDNFHSSLWRFKEATALSHNTTIKHCLRLLCLRVSNSNSQLFYTNSEAGEVPMLLTSRSVPVPSTVRSALLAYSQLRDAIVDIKNFGADLLKLLDNFLLMVKKMEPYLDVFNERGEFKKFHKAQGNFMWNTRVLKIYYDHLSECIDECTSSNDQIQQAINCSQVPYCTETEQSKYRAIKGKSGFFYRLSGNSFYLPFRKHRIRSGFRNLSVHDNNSSCLTSFSELYDI